ncbi:MAG: type II toxin-antitoxin system prevent-host-death family antitoxin [Paludibacteraceae bacterium]|nr:type II toxin-antitoxin system prevent-host-death family antitoxin [Paludibacteraceae bacterium]
MVIVSSREFRMKQGEYLKQALEGQDVILTSRGCGSFRLVPVTEKDKLESGDHALQARLDRARKDLSEGKCVTIQNSSDIDKLIEERKKCMK